MLTALVAILAATTAPAGDGPKPFAIRVIDDRSGRGVPLVELETVNNIRLVSDSAGVVAFDEPGLVGKQVFFGVKSPGYELAPDGFGFRGRSMRVEPGGVETLSVRRVNIAERLYRVTGAGIYGDSVRTGGRPPIREPLLNAQVFGSDSVVNAIYGGKLRWFWGDTNRPGYPLGNFHTPGASSLLPAQGGLDPDLGVDLDYLVDADGFARPTCRMPGEGPTWIGGLAVVADVSGRERMFAHYAKVRNWLDVYERGVVEWNDEAERFEKAATWPAGIAPRPEGHTIVRDGYVYFCNPFPLTRVRADPSAIIRPEEYETFTCLKAGGKIVAPEVDRDRSGRVRYAWKPNAAAVGPRDQAKLIESGAIGPEEILFPLREADTGEPVIAHGGSLSWNIHRTRWVLIAVQAEGGPSRLGEVWFAEADTPLGPWAYARKVVTHPRYSFYNPKQHPYFEKEKGRILYFEGTYCTTFSGNDNPTPRYDYNQLMYKLDLDDPRLNLPVPIYEKDGLIVGPRRRLGPDHDPVPASFFALERPGAGTIPVFEVDPGGRAHQLSLSPPAHPDGRPPEILFHAFPAETKLDPNVFEPLFEYAPLGGSSHSYAAGDRAPKSGLRWPGKAICQVWRRPSKVILPRD